MPEIKTEFGDLKVSDGTTMRSYVAQPKGHSKPPGLLVFQEAFGVNEQIREVTDRFAKEGYLAIAPELFHRTASPGFEGNHADFHSAMPHVAALNDIELEVDIRATYDALLRNSAIDPRRIASVGFCLGGRASFLSNLVVPLHAAISFYGGGIAPRDRQPGLLDRVGEIHGPIMMFWGGVDKHIGPEQRRAVGDSLREANKTFASVEFADADHAFFNDARPSYHKTAAQQAWELSLTFLKNNLA